MPRGGERDMHRARWIIGVLARNVCGGEFYFYIQYVYTLLSYNGVCFCVCMCGYTRKTLQGEKERGKKARGTSACCERERARERYRRERKSVRNRGGVRCEIEAIKRLRTRSTAVRHWRDISLSAYARDLVTNENV